ncbi:MAG: type I-E CRISPR-associated protein Cse2/CasB [Deltaproteobacteria bacterium]|nr:type I-E CRISPR-associated protein Cse2/CasB [Deltaproteobacteria bacterium]
MTMSDPESARQPSIWQSWWKQLQENRGGRAELARCGTVAEAAFCAPFHLLRRRKGNPQAEIELNKLGLIAAVLAHVDKDDPDAGSLGKQMAAPQGDKAVVSDVRFRHLLRSNTTDWDERLVALVRVLRQLGGRASVDRLATDLWWWNDKTKQRWALDYYEAQPEPANARE